MQLILIQPGGEGGEGGNGGEDGGESGDPGGRGGEGGDDGDGTAPPPQTQHMVFEEKSVSSVLPQKKTLSLYPDEQPSPRLSVAVPSKSLHPDSDRARIPSAFVLNTFGVMGSADFRGGGSKTCPADGTASTMRAPPWSDRSPSVAARVAGGGLGGGIRTARSTGNHCGGHATPRTGSSVFELRGKDAAGLGCVRGRWRSGLWRRGEQPRAIQMCWSKGTSGVTARCSTR
eukprot:scaffold70870_cov51-Phaeocystis_antarctica.AAC.1